MTTRIWDRFLTDQDRAYASANPAVAKGAKAHPALLMVDLYRWAFGDEPLPLLESIRLWPGSCGLSGWEALPHIQQLLAAARDRRIPVFHLTGFNDLPGWRIPRGPANPDRAMEDRRRRRYEIVPEVAPLPGEAVLRKTAPSAFWGTPLAGLLNGLGIDTVIVAGESTSGCVRATVVDATSYRYRVLVPEECVFDRQEATHALNLFDMDQKYADVLPLADVIGYLGTVQTERLPEP